MSSVRRMLSARDIFVPGSVFLRVRGAVGGNGVRPNGIRAPTWFRVSSCGRNTSLHLNYVRACSGKLSRYGHHKNAVSLTPGPIETDFLEYVHWFRCDKTFIATLRYSLKCYRPLYTKQCQRCRSTTGERNSIGKNQLFTNSTASR